MYAGTFGHNALVAAFGPELKFVKAPAEGQVLNMSPSDGLQFFYLVDIDRQSQRMMVRLMDRDDSELHAVSLDPSGTRISPRR